MSRYNANATPMDFEFQDGTGPIDARSPFAQVSANAQRLPGGMSMGMGNMGSPPKKRTHNTSPTKSTSRTTPALPTKQLPPTPAAFNSLYNTPRRPRPEFEIDDSSAGETPMTPADSPDVPMHPQRAGAGALIRLGNGSPTKDSSRPEPSRRDSLTREMWNYLKGKMTPSPGRGSEFRFTAGRKDHSGAIEKPSNNMNAVARKRKGEVDRRERKGRKRRRSSISSDDSNHSSHNASRHASGAQQSSLEATPKPHFMSTLFTFLASHPTIPHILSYYAQFAFNLFLLCSLAYLGYGVYAAVLGDIDKKASESMADVMAEIAKCGESYRKNGCDTTTGVVAPALQPLCDQWRRCMAQDEKKVARAKLSAHAFAEIFNGFVEPISYKAMVFACVMVFGGFGISNLAFGYFRSKTLESQQAQHYSQAQHYAHPPYPFSPPPPTPRQFSGENYYAGGPGTPWAWQMPNNGPGGGLEPQPSGREIEGGGGGSPVRRLVWN